MTTTHTMASSTFLGNASFWEIIWWLGIAGIVFICFSSVKSLGVGRTLIVGFSLTAAWIPVFAILWFIGMMLGAASESYDERYEGSAIDMSHVETGSAVMA